MKEFYIKKIGPNIIPLDKQNADAIEALKNGEYKCVLTKSRNINFHRKLFSLLNLAYDLWEPGEIKYKGIVIQKNRDRFRKDLIIMAGFYTMVFNYKGEPRLEAKSLSFARMEEEEFERLYSKFIDIILEKILVSYSEEELQRCVNQVLSYD